MRFEKHEILSPVITFKYFCEVCGAEFAHGNQAEYCETKHKREVCTHPHTYLDLADSFEIDAYCSTCNKHMDEVTKPSYTELVNNQEFLAKLADLIKKFDGVKP